MSRGLDLEASSQSNTESMGSLTSSCWAQATFSSSASAESSSPTGRSGSFCRTSDCQELLEWCSLDPLHAAVPQLRRVLCQRMTLQTAA